MVRAPCCEKMGMKKGAWTKEEDQILVNYVNLNGHSNWRALPKLAGLARCGKSCRLRWINYLRPDVKRGNFSRDEEDAIIELHRKMGNRWSAIAAEFPGRTDNEIKNVWHTHLKKRASSESLIGISNSINLPQADEGFWSEVLSDDIINGDDEDSPISDVTPSSSSSPLSTHLPVYDCNLWVVQPDNSSSSSGDGTSSEVVAVEDMVFWFNVFTRADEFPPHLHL